jgi:adenylate cyclase
MTRLRRPSFVTLLTGTFALAGILWGGFLGTRQIAGLDSGIDRVEYLTLDWRFLLAGVQTAPRGVVIAAVDDATLREVGSYPLPRDTLARVVRGLAAVGPQAIAIDMLFLDPGKPEMDADLAAALRAGPSVVGAVGAFDRDEPRADGHSGLNNPELVPAPSNVHWPIESLRAVTRVGLVNLSTDSAGVPRFVPMVYRIGDTIAPSFALAALSAALNTEPVFGSETIKLAARTVHMDLGYHLPIRYYGPRGTIRQFSAARALHGDISPDLVRGQLVIIGVTALGTGDTFANPFDRVVPGVEIFATAVSNLLAGDGLIRSDLTRKIDAAAAMVLPALLVLLLGIRRVAVGVGLAGVVLASWIAAIYAVFPAGYWLSIALPLSAALPIAGAYGLARLVTDRTLSQRLSGEKQALAKFQSPLLVQHILANPKFLEKPVRQDIPVVFLDLSGFTGVAESLGPQWARDLLADFQSRVEHEVVAHGGYVVSFMGDGAMIIFGLPTAKPDDGSRAMRAIMGLRKSVTTWFGTLPPVAKDRLDVRIGGHFGPVVISRLGPAEHQHVTATGDTVNVASRLLEVAKQQRSNVVVTEDLWNAAAASGDDAIVTSPVIEVDIRGRARALRVRTLG